MLNQAQIQIPTPMLISNSCLIGQASLIISRLQVAYTIKEKIAR